MSKIDVIGLGAMNMDRVYRVERILDDGESLVEEAKSFPGGSAANTIYGLAKLGVKTGFVGTVGDDADGETLLRDLQEAGTDTGQIRIKAEAKTGTALCFSDKLGRRSIYLLPGANKLLTADDLEIDYINRAGMLHLSSFADDRQFKVILELVDKLDASVRLSFAPGALYAVKGVKALKPILAKTHVLFVNRNEIQQLTGEDIADGAEACLKQGCNTVVVTLGKGASYKGTAASSYIKDTRREYTIESKPRAAAEIDTTGAGDAFAAGFLFGLLNGKDPRECGHLGDIAAQFSITGTGARDGLPTLAELSQRYHKLYQRQL